MGYLFRWAGLPTPLPSDQMLPHTSAGAQLPREVGWAPGPDPVSDPSPPYAVSWPSAAGMEGMIWEEGWFAGSWRTLWVSSLSCLQSEAMTPDRRPQ